jgi:hypothetical protein
LVLGILLLVLARRQQRSRAVPGTPAWLAATARLAPARAGGLGLVLSAVNPKNLVACGAAADSSSATVPSTTSTIPRELVTSRGDQS